MNGSRISATLGAALACFALKRAIAQEHDHDRSEEDAEGRGDRRTNPKAPPPTAAGAEESRARRESRTEESAGQGATEEKWTGSATATPQGGTVQKYEAGKAPDLKDLKGNTIPDIARCLRRQLGDPRAAGRRRK